MFTKQNTDPDNILIWDALQEIMESDYAENTNNFSMED